MHSIQDLRILVTRPRNQANAFARMLRSKGAIPIHFPVIEIAPLVDHSRLDAALLQLHLYDWLVLTSTNGVEAVGERLALLGINTLPGGVRVAAIGPHAPISLERHWSTGFEREAVEQMTSAHIGPPRPKLTKTDFVKYTQA
jgi:uroporphyrinogen-III synthase